jgi:hypothetical protein
MSAQDKTMVLEVFERAKYAKRVTNIDLQILIDSEYF